MIKIADVTIFILTLNQRLNDYLRDVVRRLQTQSLIAIAISEEKNIEAIIEACRNNDRKAQEVLYRAFYGYAMAICRRYSRSQEEAIEILNDGFFKIMTQLDKYTSGLSFKGWVRRIMINAAIDHFRRNERHYNAIDISYIKEEDQFPDVLHHLSEEIILKAIQQLPPSYQIVFNLYVIEGFGHEEIAQKLGISVGTSKSNLSVARTKLMKWLGAEYDLKKEKNG